MPPRLDKYNFEQFCNRWLEKASEYGENTLSDLFDKYSTYWVIYNRTYIEIANYLLKINHHLTRDIFRRGLNRNPADRIMATKGVAAYIILERNEVEMEPQIKIAINNIVGFINRREYYFHDDNLTGDPDYGKDINIAKGMSEYKLLSILELLYKIRCNIFHGGKQYHENQRRLLVEVVPLLGFITRKTLNKVLNDQNI